MNTSDPHTQVVPEVTQPKHSGFGVGSFVLSILSGSLMLILTITASVMDENGIVEDDTEMQVVGILIFGSMMLGQLRNFAKGVMRTLKKNATTLGAVLQSGKSQTV